LRKADDLIDKFLNSIGNTEGSTYVGLFRSWKEIIGQDRPVADHSRPVDVHGHTLVIEADHPGWIQMVMMKSERIIRELKQRFPELGISAISVRTVTQESDRISSRRDSLDTTTNHHTDENRSPLPKPSADDTEALSRISDDTMRETLERLRKEIDDR
jgi:hypothetical protein